MAHGMFHGTVGNFLLAMISCVLLYFANGAEVDAITDQLISNAKACVNESKMPDDQFENMVAKKELPTTEEGKCFLKCIMEKLEFISEGSINVVTLNAALDEKLSGNPHLDTSKKIVQECSESVKPAEGCEYAATVKECMYGSMEKAGLSPASLFS